MAFFSLFFWSDSAKGRAKKKRNIHRRCEKNPEWHQHPPYPNHLLIWSYFAKRTPGRTTLQHPYTETERVDESSILFRCAESGQRSCFTRLFLYPLPKRRGLVAQLWGPMRGAVAGCRCPFLQLLALLPVMVKLPLLLACTGLRALLSASRLACLASRFCFIIPSDLLFPNPAAALIHTPRSKTLTHHTQRKGQRLE